ncbi:CRISPR-associated protein Cas4 [Nitrososphaera viennensis]|uniref:CRISPR-associated exonuclease Cas4 n=2 Tax=Nitrososphaera viennensis TaxID=1034015 RepID=A0A060HJZ2_9ARCH|nr:CRISPR-associated protein Cas4 [Nitrososphaera viennensis]AIC16849.1 CRISPR-associated exonuclease, Cas4 family [Nitrososphaera viennensis EN76]UVS68753.1 CRISPR-associated protein Cas4 [Nitrososphaera viennensis]
MQTLPDELFKQGENLQFTGTQINYYFVCKRKLWFFSHNMTLESDSDLVLMGKLLHENSYKRKPMKEIEIDRIKIDFVEKSKEVHEVKRSRKIEDAHIYQLLYYLYFLKKSAGLEAKGVLDYPLLKKKVNVELTSDKETELAGILANVGSIINQDKPPEAEWKSYCKNCAYRELCWG